jgi:hypothetical protein
VAREVDLARVKRAQSDWMSKMACQDFVDVRILLTFVHGSIQEAFEKEKKHAFLDL